MILNHLVDLDFIPLYLNNIKLHELIKFYIILLYSITFSHALRTKLQNQSKG